MESNNKLISNKSLWIKLLCYNVGFILLFTSMFIFINDNIQWRIIIPAFLVMFIISFVVNQRLKREIEEKKATEKALKHREKLFRGIFNNAAAGIALLDKEGYYQHVNLTLSRMLGYSEDELKKMTFQDITYPEDLNDSIRLYQGIWDGSCTRVNFEKRYVCKNGDMIWIEINMSAILGDDGGITDIIVVVLDITVRKLMEQELILQATTDCLTGVDNRLAFMKKAQEEFIRSKRYKIGFSLLLLDVDKFKCVNDIYGHLVGDRVLRDVVKACKSALRENDIIARIGGEEFAVIIIESQPDDAYCVALRIQQKVKEVVVESEDTEIQVTVSIGIGMRREEDTNLDDILKRADDALYCAKNSGRNCIIFEK